MSLWTDLPAPSVQTQARTPLVTETGAELVTESGSVLATDLAVDAAWSALAASGASWLVAGPPSASTWAPLVPYTPPASAGYASGYGGSY